MFISDGIYLCVKFLGALWSFHASSEVIFNKEFPSRILLEIINDCVRYVKSSIGLEFRQTISFASEYGFWYHSEASYKLFNKCQRKNETFLIFGVGYTFMCPLSCTTHCSDLSHPFHGHRPYCIMRV